MPEAGARCRCWGQAGVVAAGLGARSEARVATPTHIGVLRHLLATFSPLCSASELPKPEVSLELKGYPPYTTPVLQHTLQPR